MNDQTSASLRMTVAQIGAREHYAVARAFAASGHLRALYTDAWCRWGHGILKRGPRMMRGWAGRFHPDVPSSAVISFAGAMWLHQFKRDPYSRFLCSGNLFARKVRDHLQRQALDPARDAFFGYDTGCLEVLPLLNKQGITSIVDQIDAARTAEDLVIQEVEAWPGWEQAPRRAPQAYWERLAAEWELASIVLVNSPWTKQALIAQGVPEAKIVVVPLAYEPSPHAHAVAAARAVHNGPLKVLWLGHVALRKGIPYFFEAARLLSDFNIRFIAVGDICISRDAIACMPPNVQLIGHVSRDQVSDYYKQADVFVLPTLSDGFAITQLEAMAQGLPVIATPNCGQVVTHGQDGFIIPLRDGAAIADAILRMNTDRERLNVMSRQAAKTSRQFTLSRYAQSVEEAVLVNGCVHAN